MIKLKKTYSRAKMRYNLRLLIFALLYWNIAIRIAIFLRLMGAKNHDFRDVLSKGMEFVLDKIFISSVIISLFAILSWGVMNFIYPTLVRKFRVRRLAIGVVIFDTAFFFVIAILLGIVHYSVDKDFTLIDSISKLKDFLFNSTILFFFVVMFIGSYVFQLVNTLFHQIGYAPLGKIMMGYYQKPREENHIFMFLDLQSSTTFAEKLGHERYSDFIQECFRYISRPLLASMGRVYQFVGDEVVITWNATKDKNFKRAVDFYYLYEFELSTRKNYFEEKYGLMPVFTASINAGKVMAAEVGEIKRELAYHGDVLNTAARIQKQCKRYRKQILVTRNFAAKLLKIDTDYKLNYIDIVKFFGKDRTVKIYEVCKPEQVDSY